MQQKIIPASGSTNSANWLINDNGVFFSKKNCSDWLQISTEPVSVLAVLIDRGFYSLEVSFPSLNGRSIIAPRSDFLNSSKIRNTGLPIVPSFKVRNAASLMSNFISDMEKEAPDISEKDALIYHRVKRQLCELSATPATLTHSATPLSSAVPETLPILNTLDATEDEHGTEHRNNDRDNTWLNTASIIRTDFPDARAIMAVSFASPLVSLLGHRNIFYHISGPSLTGKMAMLRFAMSIWGDPKKLCFSYYATDAGLRQCADMIDPLPLALDQVELSSPSKFPMLVYELSEHYFRDDSASAPLSSLSSSLPFSQKGLIHKRPEWHNCIISTGNKSILSIAPELKHYPSLLNVKAEPLIPMSQSSPLSGMSRLSRATVDKRNAVNDLKNAVKGRDVVNKQIKERNVLADYFGHYIWSVANESYGFAGRKFITYLEAYLEQEKGQAVLKADYHRMFEELYSTQEARNDGIRYEWIQNVAVIALADYYASIAVFGVKGKAQAAQAWNEAVELGKRILKEAI